MKHIWEFILSMLSKLSKRWSTTSSCAVARSRINRKGSSELFAICKVHFWMVVGALTGHCPFEIHAVRLKILPDASCISCLKKRWNSIISTHPPRMSRLWQIKVKIPQISYFLTSRRNSGNRNMVNHLSRCVIDSERFADSWYPTTGVFYVASQRTVHNSIRVIIVGDQGSA